MLVPPRRDRGRRHGTQHLRIRSGLAAESEVVEFFLRSLRREERGVEMFRKGKRVLRMVEVVVVVGLGSLLKVCLGPFCSWPITIPSLHSHEIR